MQLIRILATAGKLRAAQDRSGVAMVEFALVLPFLILLGIGGTEVTNYVVTYLRVNEIAMTVADNAGRVRQAMDESDINELMVGARLIGTNINFAQNGRIILSDLEQRTTILGPHGIGTISATNPLGLRQWIRWQRCSGALAKTSSWTGPLDKNGAAVTNLSATVTNADGTTNNDHGALETQSNIDGMGPSPQIAAGAGTAVMVAEVYYQYTPLIAPLNVIGNVMIHTTEAFNIRQRTDFSVYNAGSLTGSARSDCLLNSATVPTG